MALIVIRVMIFMIGYVFGYDYWIVPNLLSDRMTFIESLSPIVGYRSRKDDWTVILLRSAIVVGTIGIIIHAYLNPEHFIEIWKWIEYISHEVLEWGYKKLTNWHVKFYLFLFFCRIILVL